jgi:MFS family permease
MTDIKTEGRADDRPQARRGFQRALSPFRIPAYRKLAVALVLTTFTWGVWMIALVWEVIRIGGGATQLSMVSGANALGMLLPCLVAGVVADRVPQKTILVGVASVYLAGITVTAALSLTDLTQLWHLVAVAFSFGFATSFYYPAYSAWLPALVPAEDLLAVNGFEGMVRPTIGQALGPAVAGFVVAASASGWAILVAAVAAGLGLLALLPVPRTPVRRDLSASVGVHPVRSALHDIGEGFGYMVRTPWLLATLLFASLMILLMMGPFEVLVPFLIKDGMGGDAGDHALVLGAFGIGGAIGSIAMAARPMPRRYLTVMNLGWGLGCLPLALYGYVDHVWVLIVLSLFVGALFSGPMVIWGTLLQRRVPPEMLGRVSSLDFFVSLLLMPVSMAVAGPVAEAIGLRNTFLVAGLTPMVIAAVAIVWARLAEDELTHPLG